MDASWLKFCLQWLARRLNEVQFLHVAAAKQLHPYLSRTTAWGWICRVRSLVFTGLGVFKFGQNLQHSCKEAQGCGTSGVMLTCMYLTARSAMTNLNLWVQGNGALMALIANPEQSSSLALTMLGLFAFPALRMARVVKSSRLAGALKGLWKTLRALDMKAWVGSVGAIMLKFTHPSFGKVHRVIQAAKKVARAVPGVKVHEWGLAGVLMVPKLGAVRESLMQASTLDAGVGKLLRCLSTLVSSGEWPLLFIAAPLKCHLMTSPAEAKLLEHSVAVVSKMNDWTHTHPAPSIAFMAGLWCAAIPGCRQAAAALLTPAERLKSAVTHSSKRLPLSRSMRIGSRLLVPAPLITSPASMSPSPTPQTPPEPIHVETPATSHPAHPRTFKQQCVSLAEATVQQLFVVGTATPATAATAGSSDPFATVEDKSDTIASGADSASSSADSASPVAGSLNSKDGSRGLNLRAARRPDMLSQATLPSGGNLAAAPEVQVRWQGLDGCQGFAPHASACAVCSEPLATDEAEWRYCTHDMHDGYVGLLGQFQPCGTCQDFHVCQECHHGAYDQRLRDACRAGSALVDFVTPLIVGAGESKIDQ